MITVQNVIDAVERLERDDRFSDMERRLLPITYDRSKDYAGHILVDCEYEVDYHDRSVTFEFSTSLGQSQSGDHFCCYVPGYWYTELMNYITNIIHEDGEWCGRLNSLRGVE